jgi:Ti-type conjugative transfer relaxase TraA
MTQALLSSRALTASARWRIARVLRCAAAVAASRAARSVCAAPLAKERRPAPPPVVTHARRLLAHRRQQRPSQGLKIERVCAGRRDQLTELADPAALQRLRPVSEGAQFGVDIAGFAHGGWLLALEIDRSIAALDRILDLYSCLGGAKPSRRTYSPEGALIRRADVRLSMGSAAHGDLSLLGEGDLPRGRLERRGRRRLSFGLAAARRTTRSSHDFTNKAGVVHSEILLPEGAPARWRDRATLWNEVEASEKRKDAQLAREVEFAIPREMSQAEGIALAKDFVQREFVDRGMVADLNVHWDVAEDGSPKPHAHVMLTMREAKADGFGAKIRDWNRVELLEQWREAWAEHVNQRLAALDIDIRVDHRSLENQGVGLEPQHKIGAAGAQREARGEAAERLADHREIARRNGERIIADPKIALDAITHQQSTFTNHDLARFIHRHSDDKDQLDRAMSAVKTSPDFIALGRDGLGRERFTSREMLGVELALEQTAEVMAGRTDHVVPLDQAKAALTIAIGRTVAVSDEQAMALLHMTTRADLALVMGYAGSGKSTLLGIARDVWEDWGFTVRGAALSAENLENGSGISSRTLASLEYAWARGRDHLTSKDVLVIDEAGMVGSRQMQRVLAHAERAGAKVVIVGDPEQLQAIEAGAAFRALAERHGAAEITGVRRQREDWQRQATRELATGRTGAALERYERAGMVMAHGSREAAQAALVEGWSMQRERSPRTSQIILAYTRADVAALNGLARERLKAAGELGDEQNVTTTRGPRVFAAGDRVMFLRNERSLGVKNGTLGTIDAVNAREMAVQLDDGRQVAFDFKDYADLDHGYAATVHKAQGVTVENTHVLASGHMDRHAAYVALTRHRDSVALHCSREEFATVSELARSLGRERAKDVTLDYVQAFGAPHGVEKGQEAATRTRSVAADIRSVWEPPEPVRPISRERERDRGRER